MSFLAIVLVTLAGVIWLIAFRLDADGRAEAAVRMRRMAWFSAALATSVAMVGALWTSGSLPVPDRVARNFGWPGVADAVVFVITWWTTLFAVLPWGNRPAAEPEPGHAASAPERPRIGLKMLATTAISLVLWMVIYVAIRLEVFSFREWVHQTNG